MSQLLAKRKPKALQGSEDKLSSVFFKQIGIMSVVTIMNSQEAEKNSNTNALRLLYLSF